MADRDAGGPRSAALRRRTQLCRRVVADSAGNLHCYTVYKTVVVHVTSYLRVLDKYARSGAKEHSSVRTSRASSYVDCTARRVGVGVTHFEIF